MDSGPVAKVDSCYADRTQANVTNPLRELKDAAAWLPGDPYERTATLGRNVLPSGGLMGLANPQIEETPDGSMLVYRVGDFLGGKAADPRGLLGTFMQIDDVAGVLRFAKKFGPLGLCVFGLPFSARFGLPFSARYPEFNMSHDHDACRKAHFRHSGSEVEAVEPWLHLASRSEAIVRLAVLVQTDNREGLTGEVIRKALVTQRAEWLQSSLASGEAPHGEEFVEHGDWKGIVRFFIQDAIDSLLWAWQVRPWFSMSRGVLVGMFTREFIPLQLAGIVSDARALAVCSACKQAYLRKRAAPVGPVRAHNYCPRCKSRGVDNTERQARYRVARAPSRAAKGRGPELLRGPHVA